MTDWFDDLPAGWDVSRLKNIIESTQTGVWGDDPRGDDDDIRCVRVADFDRPRSGVGPVKTFRSVSPNDREDRLLTHGDILVEKSGGTDNNPVGFSVMFTGDYPAVSSNFITRLRVKPTQLPRFWLYALDASYATKRTERFVRRTTGIQNLDQKAFLSDEFPVPPLAEQRAIADFLDRETARIDMLIDEQQRLIELSRERRTAIRTQCALEGTRPKDLVASPLPWAKILPSEWRVVPLTSVARLESGHTPSRARDDWWQDCYIPWISLNDVGAMRGTKYLETTTHQLSDEGIANSSARLLPANTVVLSRDATVGRTAIMKIAMATSQHFAAWICGPRLDPEYLWTLITDAMQPYFASFQNGSTIRTIGMGDLKAFRIPLPPLDEQRRIVAYLDEQTAQIDDLIAETERLTELARERRSALITAAVTGQIEVRNKVA